MVVAVNNVIEQREEKRGRMFSKKKMLSTKKKLQQLRLHAYRIVFGRQRLIPTRQSLNLVFSGCGQRKSAG